MPSFLPPAFSIRCPIRQFQMRKQIPQVRILRKRTESPSSSSPFILCTSLFRETVQMMEQIPQVRILKIIDVTTFLFKLKHFQFTDKIKESHPVFNENYFICTIYTKVYVGKRIDNKFKSVEILNGLRIIRKIKLQNIWYFK